MLGTAPGVLMPPPTGTSYFAKPGEVVHSAGSLKLFPIYVVALGQLP
jgi:hypothetical protein